VSTAAVEAPRPLVFCDTETTGLGWHDQIWEFAAIRREPDGTERTFHTFVQHNLNLALALPDSFRADHDARYDPTTAVRRWAFADLLGEVFAGRPYVVGAVPNFDTERLARILADAGQLPLWHYHLRDVETLARGYLLGRASLGDLDAGLALGEADDSDALSRACGVEPPTTERHTAMGDVLWCKALHDAVTEPAVEFVPAARRLGYAPALIHGRKSTLWVHGCGHVESWPTDPKYPPIKGEGCDACESAPDGTWRQLYLEVPGE
jgi:hypothetical protein